MRFFLNDGPHRVQVLSPDRIRRFHDLGTARTFLAGLLDEPGNRLAVREALAGDRVPTPGLSDEALVDELADRLVYGDLRLVSCASPFHALGSQEEAAGGSAAGASEAAETTPLEDEQAAKEEKGEEEPEEEHWLEIELVDDEGNPVAGEKYFVTLPDGSSVSGRLDGDGFARLEGIDPGTAKVSFPDLDKDLYEED